jgi:hypothetical protein
MTDTTAVRPRPSRTERFVLLVVLLGAPIAWALHLFGSHVYVPAACAGLPMWGLHLITVVALGTLAVSSILGYAVWTERIRPEGVYAASARQVATVGLLLAIFFLALILLQAWPNLVADPCGGIGVSS